VSEPSLALRDAWLDDAVEIVVPALWTFEVGNVLGLKQPARADELLDAMVELSLPEAPAAPYAARIFDLMRRHGATFYDAAYHGLAIERGGVMVTADRRYIAKCGRAGHVEYIGDWRSAGGSVSGS